ncbi:MULTISPECIES: LLM class flavin-dependent oxidoreductase [Streptomyces]|uniref:LLM class flavin-dependent oxidoreductase n=1 Tax=Streptomyces TaxID=1883 RepID=UPI001938F900|nr:MULTISPECIES: LLM class flavin-dependent oxidoreductase [unclassified Streptomyces]MCU4745770.1 LLM class flavin-dependent oxidoreductase [Streptomyces sp. G-5]QQN79266.1 LLM class flavin-dependent oxidoreductase [Streptomyces sp. XC 2026]
MTDIGVMVPRDLAAERFIQYVRRAEELGFAEVWVVEDCFFRGGFTQAAVALAVTERIRVGIGILPAVLRNPALTAMEAATLAQLYPGRPVLGVGHGMPGWMRQVGAYPASPLGALGEHLRTVRALLRGETVRDERLDAVTLDLPVPVVPPVLAGVRGPKSLALSGREADGTILAEPVTPEYLAAARGHIGARAVAEGHRVVAYNVAAVDDDPQVARAAVRPALEWIGEPDWAPHITPLPFAAEFARLREESADRTEFAARLPGEWVDQLAVTGTPGQARERIAALHAAGAGSVVLMPAGPDPLVALEGLGRVL